MKAKCSPFPALTPTHNHPNSAVIDKSVCDAKKPGKQSFLVITAIFLQKEGKF